MTNKTKYKILDVVNNDPRVYEVYEDTDGIWLEPNPGWTADPLGAHGAREDTATAVLRRYRNLSPCDCSQCHLSA